jgi:hypothetical protein
MSKEVGFGFRYPQNYKNYLFPGFFCTSIYSINKLILIIGNLKIFPCAGMIAMFLSGTC